MKFGSDMGEQNRYKLYSIVKKQGSRLWISFLLFVGITFFSLIEPRFYRILIDDHVMPKEGNMGIVLKYMLIILALKFSVNLFSVVRNHIMADMGSELSKDLRQLVYEKLQNLSVQYIMERKTGDLMNRVTGDTNHIRDFIQGQFSQVLNQLFILVGASIILFSKNWRMGLLIVLPAPFIVMVSMHTRRHIYYMYGRQRRQWDRTNSFLQDILSGIQVVKIFGKEDMAVERFKEDSKELMDITVENERLYATLYPILNFITRIGSIFILYYGGVLILDQRLKVGELIEFMQYGFMVYGPLQWMSFFPRILADATASMNRILEILEEEPKVEEHPNAISHDIQGAISFKDVTFSYTDGDNVLDGISLDIERGEMIGLVGRSGAGKSTFINLVMRFYDPDEGDIFLDGINLKEISQDSYRNQLGVVLQETFLFEGSILENIRYSKPNATLEEVIIAAKIANAHDFIMEFPDGYDTTVGERGQRLSGGERQRIAIARAILCDPKILILDEATASVDTDTEQKIQEALSRVIEGRTTIAIAHRLSTLRNANRLVVIDDGKIAEVGSHSELMAAGGIYHNMVTIQNEINRL